MPDEREGENMDVIQITVCIVIYQTKNTYNTKIYVLNITRIFIFYYRIMCCTLNIRLYIVGHVTCSKLIHTWK